MTPLLTKPKPAPHRSRGDLVVAALIGVIGVALLVPGISVLRLPPSVEAVTVVNPHPWGAEVDVGRPDESRWIGLGYVGRDSASTFYDVIDPGDEWAFRFFYAGIEEARVVVSRAELEQSKWNVRTPDDFAQRLRTAGEPPSPSD
jgi:hypothetical protein